MFALLCHHSYNLTTQLLGVSEDINLLKDEVRSDRQWEHDGHVLVLNQGDLVYTIQRTTVY
jgi:hypothetical protein